MTIGQAGKGKVRATKKAVPYRIGFNDGDETELDATSMGDLKELWKSLCTEFGCAEDSVDYVERA